MVEVIRAGIENIDVVADLFNQYRIFYGQDSDIALSKAFITERMQNDESVILLAGDAHGVALGFTQLYPSFSSVSALKTWILNDLYVAKQARGQGVGTALLNAAKAHAQSSGAARLTLETAKDNHTAQRLYESLGYQRDSSCYHYALAVNG